MEKAELKDKQYEVSFTSTGRDIVQTVTDTQTNVFVYARLEEDAPWCRINTIPAGNKITILKTSEGMLLKIASNKQFSYAKI